MSQTKCSTTDTPKRAIYVPRDQMRVVEPMPAQTAARELTSLMITSESVVATATLVFDDAHRSVSIRWGDGTTEVINISALRLLKVPGALDDQSPNTLRVQHAYTPPFDTGSRLITVVSVDDQGVSAYESVVIELERRYRVNLYSVVLEFPHHLDSALEQESEIQATMHASFDDDRFFSKSWQDSVVTAPNIGPIDGQPITWLLEGSSFQRDISSTDEPIKIDFDLAENDGPGKRGSIINDIWDVLTSPVILLKLYPLSTNPALAEDFDVPNRIEALPFTLHPDTSLDTNVATAVFRLPLDRGVVFGRFHYEVRLLVPLDVGGRQLMTTT